MDTVFDRTTMLEKLRESPLTFDMVVIGGGATGAGTALDAASRGYRVVLLEQSDFGKATSSRSTKLIHGGVRYLQQGNVGLVREALRERALLCENARHLVHPIEFVLPIYRWWESTYYWVGLRLYDFLAGRRKLGRTKYLDRNAVVDRLETINPDGLRSGLVYYDAMFDDARLLLNLLQTAVKCGAICLNYVRVLDFIKEHGSVAGVVAKELEGGEELRVGGRVIINATGAFADSILQMDDADATPMISPSQGIHIVLRKAFLPGKSAMLIPRTRDGRVVFAVPWNDRVLIGTTDTAVDTVRLEPEPLPSEVDYLLATIGPYLLRQPTRSDVCSVFAGIRPLVTSGKKASTSKLSREHTIRVSDSGLLTIVGGKWTTYRGMAEDCVNQAATLAGLPRRPCRTESLPIHGQEALDPQDGPFPWYGSDAEHITKLCDSTPGAANALHARLPYRNGHVIWAGRYEMARTIDDVLSRRTRSLTLDASAALEAAPAVAQILAGELHRDEEWQHEQVRQFRRLARHYIAPAAKGALIT